MSDNKERVTVFLSKEARDKVDKFKADAEAILNREISDSWAINSMLNSIK